MSTAVQLPLAAPPHRNRYLFADHYLDAILPGRPEWAALAAAAEPVRRAVAARYAAYKPSTVEAQVERDLIQPVLESLGHAFDVQVALKVPGGNKRPDYVLYRDAAARDANKGRMVDETLPQQGAIAVGDAKAWDRPLDQKLTGGGDLFTNKNPSYQIAFYMRYSGVEWGILTNGRLWRLYHRGTAEKLDHFYEVDLPAVLDDPARFVYFYAFFSRAAFDPAAPLGVAAILRESRESARAVGDALKGQVYDALRHLAQGVLDYAPDALPADDPATLKQVYDAALIVLYRLLFILYAEARDLLPVRANAQYREDYSLHALKERVARDIQWQRTLRPASGIFWARLLALFRIIDRGDPALGVATYNGGLFDPARHPFLEAHPVGDAHLEQAIDKLARIGGEFVDYRDLTVRHLGAIYEGLLEYHLAPLPAPDSNTGARPGRFETGPYTQNDQGGRLADPAQGWTVDLLNDKGERKATGSYYTPDYIVKYIVDATVGPVLRAAVAGAAPTGATDEAKVAAVLGLNVLDPAMGSGHFLVEATEYIARFLVELDLAPGPGGAETDLDAWKRRVVQSCIYGVDLNPLAVELAKLSLWLSTVARDRPLSFLDHHLRTGNALVGARLADLQTAPAPKEAPAAPRRPSKKEQAAAAAGQLSWFDTGAFAAAMGAAVGNMWRIEASPATTAAQVKEQEQLYANLRADLTRKYGRLADLVTATRFGLRVDPAVWPALADFATGQTVAALPKFAAWLAEAEALAARYRFFHWELEFPEVFFDRHGQPRGAAAGFDAVVGNPPYVRQETLGPYKPYFALAYPQTYNGVADLYVYFYQQGLQLTRAGGRMSYIVTNKWMRAGYGEPLRAYFAAQGALEQIIDFGHAPIFAEADVFPCVLVLEKPASPDNTPPAERQVQVTVFPREELHRTELGRYVNDHYLMVPHSRFGKAAWNLESSAVDDLMAKVRRVGVPLVEYAGVKPYRGVLTGLNEAFLIDTPTRDRLVKQDPRSAEVIKPCLRGQDIKRWTPDWQGLWMIILQSSTDYAWPWSNAKETAEEIFQQTFPALHEHLKPFEDKLMVRQDKGRYWWELRSCAYYNVFEQPKIVHTDITWRPQFALAEKPTYLLNTAYIWPTTDLYLLAVVNSPLLWAYMWRNAVHGKDEALRLIYSFTETLPIAPPTDAIRAEAEPAVARLIAITQATQESRAVMLDWLRTEFAVDAPGQRLPEFAGLDSDTFVAEVRKRRPKTAGALTPAALKALRAGYAEQAGPVQQLQTEAATLERRLADLVNTAYGLTPEEIAVLWATAPPRMPRF